MKFYRRVLYKPEYKLISHRDAKRIQEVVELCHNPDYPETADDLVEIFDIIQSVEAIKKDKDVASMDFEKITQYSKNLKSMIGKHLSKFFPDDILKYATEVHHQYVYSFWQMMVSYKKTEGIDTNKIGDLLEKHPYHLRGIACQKQLTQTVAEVLYQHLVKKPGQVSVVINELLSKKRPNEREMHFKHAFSAEQIKELFRVYIRSDAPSGNLLRLIWISQNDPQIGLDDTIRLLAKHKAEEIEKVLWEKGAIQSHGISVVFGDFDEWKKFEKNDDGFVIKYDRRWIRDNLDYPTLLDNLIHWMEFADLQCRSIFPARKRHVSILEHLFMVKGKQTYDAGMVYEIEHLQFLLQIQGYCEQLKRNDINIEDVFKWFFEEYLKTEFNVCGFSFNVPTQVASYIEKCRTIAGEMDSILKQYQIYRKYGYMDRELFEMSSEHMKIEQVESFQSIKYVYPNSEELRLSIAMLFDDSAMTISEDGKYAECDSLYDIFCAVKDVKETDFELEFQEDTIQKLKVWGVIAESNGVLNLDATMTSILWQLHEKDTICYCYCSATMKDKIDELLEEKHMCAGHSLLSLPEQEYFDYMMNKARYSDGKDLRNKYMHGNNPIDEKENYKDYYEFLLMMVLIIIKINEEFCLKYPEQ